MFVDLNRHEIRDFLSLPLIQPRYLFYTTRADDEFSFDDVVNPDEVKQ